MKIKLFTLPNILTLANLACGCVAVVSTVGWYRPNVAFWLIAAAALFDLLDGAVARATGQYSEIGKQLDSLADVVSFGVAPSAVLFVLFRYADPLWHDPLYLRVVSWSVFSVALFSAIRLAKFNVDESQTEEFEGLPTPAAALAIAALGWVLADPPKPSVPDLPSEAILFLAALVSYLLISPIRMFSLKFKSFGWRGNELQYTFLALSVVLIAVLGIGGVAAAVGLYVVLSTVRHVAGMRTAEKK